MAYKIIEAIAHSDGCATIEAVLDSAADLEALGVADADGNFFCPGSMAIVVDTGAPMYMLNASHEWKEV